MDRERGQEPLLPFLEKQWDVVRLGRWAGIFVLISALALAIWEAAELWPGDISLQVRFFWSRLVGIGSWGVIIILLAELVDRVSRGEAEEIEDGEGEE